MSDAPHTQPPAESVPANNGYQLTGDDYENIWLRVKDRGTTTFWTFVGFVLTFATLLGGVGGYEIARRALEGEVEKHTKTAEFRNSLIEFTRRQIPPLQTDLDALEARAKLLQDTIAVQQEQLAALQRSPNEIDALGARWTAPDGQSLRLQTGRVRVGGLGSSKVVFTTPFAVEPVVLITINASPFAIGRRSLISTSDITSNGMVIHSEGVDGVAHWIAIGQ